MTNCKPMSSTKELNLRLKRISDDLQDVHSQLNTVVAKQRRLDLPPRLQIVKRKKMQSPLSTLKSKIAMNNANEKAEMSEGSDTEAQVKPSVASSVISTSRILRTREDLIGLVNDVPGSSKGSSVSSRDEQFQKRNRRMLGMVMSTLIEFKQQNEIQRDPSAQRCQEVEDRRHKAAEEENHRLQNERQMLVEKKRTFLDEQRAVVAEIERAEQIQYWNRTSECLVNFIRTDCKPNIFWRPALLEARAKRKQDDSTARVHNWIERKLDSLHSFVSFDNKRTSEFDNEESRKHDSLNNIDIIKINSEQSEKTDREEHNIEHTQFQEFEKTDLEEHSETNTQFEEPVDEVVLNLNQTNDDVN